MASVFCTSSRVLAVVFAAMTAGCAAASPSSSPTEVRIVSLTFGDDYRGTETKFTELHGSYRLDLKCSGEGTVRVAVLVDNRSIVETHMPCEETSTVVSVATAAQGQVTLEIEGHKVEGSLSLSAA